VIENKICVGTDCLKATLSSGTTSLQVMVACKRCGLREQWSSDIAVSCILTKHPDIESENTVFETLWFSPQTRLSIHAADNSITLYFFQCVSGL